MEKFVQFSAGGWHTVAEYDGMILVSLIIIF